MKNESIGNTPTEATQNTNAWDTLKDIPFDQASAIILKKEETGPLDGASKKFSVYAIGQNGQEAKGYSTVSGSSEELPFSDGERFLNTQDTLAIINSFIYSQETHENPDNFIKSIQARRYANETTRKIAKDLAAASLHAITLEKTPDQTILESMREDKREVLFSALGSDQEIRASDLYVGDKSSEHRAELSYGEYLPERSFRNALSSYLYPPKPQETAPSATAEFNTTNTATTTEAGPAKMDSTKANFAEENPVANDAVAEAAPDTINANQSNTADMTAEKPLSTKNIITDTENATDAVENGTGTNPANIIKESFREVMDAANELHETVKEVRKGEGKKIAAAAILILLALLAAGRPSTSATIENPTTPPMAIEQTSDQDVTLPLDQLEEATDSEAPTHEEISTDNEETPPEENIETASEDETPEEYIETDNEEEEHEKFISGISIGSTHDIPSGVTVYASSDYAYGGDNTSGKVGGNKLSPGQYVIKSFSILDPATHETSNVTWEDGTNIGDYLDQIAEKYNTTTDQLEAKLHINTADDLPAGWIDLNELEQATITTNEGE